jgi:hypothetical protein
LLEAAAACLELLLLDFSSYNSRETHLPMTCTLPAPSSCLLLLLPLLLQDLLLIAPLRISSGTI